MKADNGFGVTGHTRIIKITGIEDKHTPEVTIVVNYQKVENDGNIVGKAIALDHIIIPRIVKALNDDDAPVTRESLLKKLQGLAEASGFVSQRALSLLEDVADEMMSDPRNA